MAFYRPSFQRVSGDGSSRRVQTNNNPLNNSGSVVERQNQQQQEGNPLSGSSDVMGLYKSGKGLSNIANKATGVYDHYFMPSGVNPASVMAGSGTETAGSAFLGASPMIEGSPFLAASTAAPTSGAGYGLLAEGAATTPLIDSAVGLGGAEGASLLGGAGAEAAALGATEGAAAAGLGGAAATEGAAAAGAIGAEAAGLGMLGPVGILAGAGLLGSKLLGMW